MWVLIQLLRLVLTSGFVYTFVVLYPQTDNLPLLIFLGVFVVLPVVLAIGELRHGRKGFQRLINSIFYALLRVFIATIRSRATDWASVAMNTRSSA